MKNWNALIGLVVFVMAVMLYAPCDHVLAEEKQKFLITADDANYDRENGIVTARGNVEIIYGGRTLTADHLNYNQLTDTVTATGNIVMLEPTGDVYFSEYLELTDEMKNGVIEQIRVLLSDESRIAAVSGIRTGGYRTEMHKAVYSPCEICREEEVQNPLWRIKSEKVIHDSNAQMVTYRNAFLEMFGIPVAYTPYLSHPDPTVERKSGFIVPRFGSTSGSGQFLQVPYFWEISPDKDFTFEPIISADDGIIVAGEYRQRFDNGELQISGGANVTDRQSGVDQSSKLEGRELRGHILGKGRFDMDDTWRWGFDVERASDRTYFKRFPYFGGFGDTLRTTTYAEGFRGRNYASANAYLFQDLRADESLADPPVILPILDFNYVGEPNSLGGKWNFDANSRFLFRRGGQDNQRLSLKPGFSIPYYSKSGQIATFRASLQADMYYVHDAASNEFTGRLLPMSMLEWRYPFYRENESVSQVFEPVLGIIVGPNGSNSKKIPNEEGNIVDFDETNLLSIDRIPGLDRVESGQRAFWGIRGELHGLGGGYSTVFVGQSYRVHVDNDLSDEFGIEERLSDYVGRINIAPNDHVNIRFRFRADNQNLNPLRNELGFNFNAGPIRLSGDYIFVDSKVGARGGVDAEEIRAQLSSSISQDWTIDLNTIRDLESAESRLNRVSLVYEDVCFRFSGSYSRSYTTVAEVGRSDQLVFRLSFKNLGEVQI